MNKYLTEKNEKMCCGCSACEQICPTKCIEIIKNEEGFYYPEIEPNKCIGCNKCVNVCPMEKYPKNMQEQTAYAVISKNEETLLKSSSGGVFYLLAQWIIKQNGVVFGAYLDKNHNLIHKGVTQIEDMEQLLGSKYIQSQNNNTFSIIKNLLIQEKYVLYVGTPCQVAGLKLFLGKEYQKLYTADLLCHGVPSNDLFKGYVYELEKKHKGKLTQFIFRDKQRYGWSITMKYVIRKNGKEKKYYIPAGLSPYFYAFLRGKVLRESCYVCPYTTLNRVGDMTLADFWGVEKVLPTLQNSKGCSCVLCNTNKGREMLDKIENDIEKYSVSLEEATIQNINFFEPPVRPEERNSIYREYLESGFKVITKKYLNNPRALRIKIKSIVRRWIKY